MTAPALERAVPLLLSWYAKTARPLPWRQDASPYRVWVSEVMLQQTRIEAAKSYFLRFMEALPTVEALAEADESLVLKLWEGLGYYSRARNLHRAAKEVVEKHGGKMPESAKGLRALPGIGAYTAGAVASICFGEAVPAVDGNVLRVVARLTADDSDVGSPATKKRVETALCEVMPREAPGAFNQALMELGETVCVPGTPRCGECPLEKICEAKMVDLQDRLPVKAKQKPRRVEPRTVFLLVCGNKLALRRRPEKGLLAGLWELPSVEGHLMRADVLRQAEAWGLRVESAGRLADSRHIFSHLEWDMQNWHVQAADCTGAFTWADARRLQTEFAIPTAFRPALDLSLILGYNRSDTQ